MALGLPSHGSSRHESWSRLGMELRQGRAVALSRRLACVREVIRP